MKAKRFQFVATVFTVLLSSTWAIAVTSSTQPVRWGPDATSSVLNSGELAKIDESVFPVWKRQQIIWPSADQCRAATTPVADELRVSCMQWLNKYVRIDTLPKDALKMLVPMKNWGLIRKESEQVHRCDVFLLRFEKDQHVVNIQESPYNVVIAVSDERLAKTPSREHKDFVVKTAAAFLQNTLLPDPEREPVRVVERTGYNGTRLTRVSWQLPSVVYRDQQGRKLLSTTKASEIGACQVDADTDGRFVRFDIVKFPKGPRSYFDPYEKRFSPEKPE